MKHPIKIENYSGSIKELSRDIANLRYDVLEIFLNDLALAILDDSKKDHSNGRLMLSKSLEKTTVALFDAKNNIINAWNIAKLHISEKE